jgi:hypothetical protein
VKETAWCLVLVGAAACSAGSGAGSGTWGGSASSGGSAAEPGGSGAPATHAPGGASGSPSRGGSGAVVQDDSGTGVTFVDGGGDSGPQSAGEYDITTGDIKIVAGDEQTYCVSRFLPTSEPIDMVSIGADMTAGGHHIIFYKSAATEESTAPTPCSAILDIGFSELSGGLAGTVPLFIAQQARTHLEFPAGVAYTFPAHQMTTVEMHFLNTTAEDMIISGTVHIGVARTGTITQKANLLFYGPGPGLLSVPPGNQTVTNYYAFGAAHATPPNIFAATTHTHQLSTGTSLAFGPQGSTRPIFQSSDWDNPQLKVFDPPLAAGPDDGLELTCSWNNTTGQTVVFGESARTNEMCLVWAYFYPDTGADVRVY